MLRTKATAMVDADGHLDGTWISDKGEKVKALRPTRPLCSHNPVPQMTELWGDKSELIRWETARDTEPVHILGDHFTAYPSRTRIFCQGPCQRHHADPEISVTLGRSQVRSENADDPPVQAGTCLCACGRCQRIRRDFTGEEGWVTLAPKDREAHVRPCAGAYHSQPRLMSLEAKGLVKSTTVGARWFAALRFMWSRAKWSACWDRTAPGKRRRFR